MLGTPPLALWDSLTEAFAIGVYYAAVGECEVP